MVLVSEQPMQQTTAMTAGARVTCRFATASGFTAADRLGVTTSGLTATCRLGHFTSTRWLGGTAAAVMAKESTVTVEAEAREQTESAVSATTA
jgi:hypothetical protein